MSVVFAGKQALKRPVPLTAPRKSYRTLWVAVSSMAAAVAAALLLAPWSEAPEAVLAPQPVIAAAPAPSTSAPTEAVHGTRHTAHGAPANVPRSIEQPSERRPMAQAAASLAAGHELVALAAPQPVLTLVIEKSAPAAEPSPAPLDRTLEERAAELLAQPRTRQFFDHLGEQSIVALNTLAGRQSLVTKTYDASGNLLDRTVTSTGLNMNRTYASK